MNSPGWPGVRRNIRQTERRVAVAIRETLDCSSAAPARRSRSQSRSCCAGRTRLPARNGRAERPKAVPALPMDGWRVAVALVTMPMGTGSGAFLPIQVNNSLAPKLKSSVVGRPRARAGPCHILRGPGPAAAGGRGRRRRRRRRLIRTRGRWRRLIAGGISGPMEACARTSPKRSSGSRAPKFHCALVNPPHPIKPCVTCANLETWALILVCWEISPTALLCSSHDWRSGRRFATRNHTESTSSSRR